MQRLHAHLDRKTVAEEQELTAASQLEVAQLSALMRSTGARPDGRPKVKRKSGQFFDQCHYTGGSATLFEVFKSRATLAEIDMTPRRCVCTRVREDNANNFVYGEMRRRTEKQTHTSKLNEC